MKTGALLLCSALMGAACGKERADEEAILASLKEYGTAIGLAFQIVDDILDVTADTALLGKTAGKDAKEDKPTYVSLLGLESAKEMAKEQYEKACRALDQLPDDLPGKERLREIAYFIVGRNY